MKTHRFNLLLNVFSLTFVRGIDMITQLITMPYLLKTVGFSGFGMISYYLVLIQYMHMVCDYGFNYTATKYVSIERENAYNVNSVFTSIFCIKGGLFIICSLILFFLCLLNRSNDGVVYLYIIVGLLGYTILPVWLFQGFEKMKYLSYTKFVSRLIFIIGVFLFIKTKNDCATFILIESISVLLSGVVGLSIAFKLFKVKMQRPKFQEMKRHFIDGTYMFLSSTCITLYRNSNIFILSFFTSDVCVGYYAAAEKVIRASQAIIEPITSALYPFVSKRFAYSCINSNISFLLKYTKYYAALGVVISLLVFLLSSEILSLLSATSVGSILDLKIMSGVIVFGIINYFAGIVGLINLGFKERFLLFVFVSGCVSIGTNLLLVQRFADVSAAISLVVGEMTLCFLTISFLLKKSMNKQ